MVASTATQDVCGLWIPICADDSLAQVLRRQVQLEDPKEKAEAVVTSCIGSCYCDTIEEGWRPCPPSLCEREDHVHPSLVTYRGENPHPLCPITPSAPLHVPPAECVRVAMALGRSPLDLDEMGS